MRPCTLKFYQVLNLPFKIAKDFQVGFRQSGKFLPYLVTLIFIQSQVGLDLNIKIPLSVCYLWFNLLLSSTSRVVNLYLYLIFEPFFVTSTILSTKLTLNSVRFKLQLFRPKIILTKRQSIVCFRSCTWTRLYCTILCPFNFSILLSKMGEPWPPCCLLSVFSIKH